MDGAAIVSSAMDVASDLMPNLLPIFGVFAGVAVVGILIGLVLRRFL